MLLLRESSIVESNCILSFWDTNWPFIKKKMIRRLISGFKAWGEWALIWISFLNLLLHNSSIHKTFDLQVCNYSLACIRGQMALIVFLFVNLFFLLKSFGSLWLILFFVLGSSGYSLYLCVVRVHSDPWITLAPQ